MLPEVAGAGGRLGVRGHLRRARAGARPGAAPAGARRRHAERAARPGDHRPARRPRPGWAWRRPRAPTGRCIGTAVPGSGTPYNWFFPNGTRLTITGARGGQYRVRLARELERLGGHRRGAAAPPRHPRPAGVGGHGARRSTTRTTSTCASPPRARAALRGGPRRATALDVTVYGAETRTNWLQYGADRPAHPPDGVGAARRRRLPRCAMELDEPLWGYLPFWDEAGNLVVRRAAPAADRPGEPAAGALPRRRRGPPAGRRHRAHAATPRRRPTSRSPKRLVALLRERGARVLETRPDTAAVGLGDRPLMATDSSVDLLRLDPQQRLPGRGEPLREQRDQRLLQPGAVAGAGARHPGGAAARARAAGPGDLARATSRWCGRPGCRRRSPRRCS